MHVVESCTYATAGPAQPQMAAFDLPTTTSTACLVNVQYRAAASKAVITTAEVYVRYAKQGQSACAHDARLTGNIQCTPACMLLLLADTVS